MDRERYKWIMAIRDSPDDFGLLGVYLDWLEERGLEREALKVTSVFSCTPKLLMEHPIIYVFPYQYSLVSRQNWYLPEDTIEREAKRSARRLTAQVDALYYFGGTPLIKVPSAEFVDLRVKLPANSEVYRRQPK